MKRILPGSRLTTFAACSPSWINEFIIVLVGNTVAFVSTAVAVPVTFVPAEPVGPSAAVPALPASVALSALPVNEPTNSLHVVTSVMIAVLVEIVSVAVIECPVYML